VCAGLNFNLFDTCNKALNFVEIIDMLGEEAE
jgi:hypothetical protein